MILDGIKSFFNRVRSRYKTRRQNRRKREIEKAKPNEDIPSNENNSSVEIVKSPALISEQSIVSQDVLNREQPIIDESSTINIIMKSADSQNTRQNELQPEFIYLKRLIDYRLAEDQEYPELPAINEWSVDMLDFFAENKIKEDTDVATLVLIALAPHIYPELFDHAIQEKLRISGDFPEIGGVRGKNFRGFLPTGQTAVFLMAGDDEARRREVERLFWSDRDLSKQKILWLEDVQEGEPVLSGKIILGAEFIDQLLHGHSAPPNFSTSFPAKRITTKLKVEDIVLSEEVKAHYNNLKDWIESNIELTQEWDRKERLKKGFKVLFYGPPGTGKTLTASVLGNETGLNVYKIDLSMVVSKYIGDTEKNLEKLFAKAQQGSILFFDEADAIFGKRTSVRDAHDKYANQEVSYLLQRIEDFDGLVILASNMKNNIDTAFIRRFNDIVRFSFPDEEERKEIWQKSFPENSSSGDIANHVKKYELTGANIINAVHFAGIQAVKRRNRLLKGNGEAMTAKKEVNAVAEEAEAGKLKFFLDDVTEGIKREMFKEGRPFPG